MHLVSSTILLSALPNAGARSPRAGAVLFIYPTLVIFEGNDRSVEITLTNCGDVIGTFETS